VKKKKDDPLKVLKEMTARRLAKRKKKVKKKAVAAPLKRRDNF
jgi:hypothetical protein